MRCVALLAAACATAPPPLAAEPKPRLACVDSVKLEIDIDDGGLRLIEYVRLHEFGCRIQYEMFERSGGVACGRESREPGTEIVAGFLCDCSLVAPLVDGGPCRVEHMAYDGGPACALRVRGCHESVCKTWPERVATGSTRDVCGVELRCP